MKRDISMDYLRSSVTMLVVAHHASLAYNTVSVYNPEHYMKSSTPIIDTVRFLPLDLFVGWNDMFFMCLMFFISGLFILPSLNRKGAGRFMTDRLERLGIPFIVCALVLAPLAYYPSWLQSNAALEGHYLYRFFTADGWTSGPAWFIWVLLAYGAVVAGAYRLFPDFMKKCSWTAGSAKELFAIFLLASLAAALPLRLFIEPGHWMHVIGPLYFHTWRGLLYFVWFLFGVFLGSADPGRSLSRKNLKPWPIWLMLGGLTYLAHGLLEQHALGPMPLPGWLMSLVLASLYCLCCTLTCLGATGLARAFFHQARPAADSLSASAYGIYIFHYVFVIWIQYALLSQPLPPMVKFLIVFAGALSASWLVTALLRRTPASRVL
ncbi:MAG TPA: acyltransferase [Smithellaceae bacterium]|nr:acyltransferase [Smithellaceae bacterium]